MNGKSTKRWMSTILLVILLAISWHILSSNLSDKIFASANLGRLAFSAIAISLAIFFIQASAQKLLFDTFGTQLRYRESFALTVANNFLNYIPAKPGLIARGAYMYRVHNMPPRDYIFATIAGQGAQAIVALLLVIFSWSLAIPFSHSTYLVVLAFGASSIIIIIFLETARRILRSVRRMTHCPGTWIWYVATLRDRVHAKRIAAYSIIFTGAMLLQSARIFVLFWSTGYNTPFFFCVFAQSLNSLATLVPILPGNVGVREAVLASALASYGTPWDAALAVAILDRAAEMVVACSCGPIFAYRLSKAV